MKRHAERLISTGLNAITSAGSANSGLALMDQLAASATNFITGVIIGRACVEAELGLYLLGLSIVMVPTLIQTSMVSAPYMVFSVRLAADQRTRYAGSTLIQQVCITSLSVLALAGFGFALLLRGPREGLLNVVWTLAAVLGFILVREFARRYLFATLEFRAALVFDIFVGVLQVGGLLILAANGLVSASRAFWVVGGAGAVVALAWLVRRRHDFSLDRRQVMAHLRMNFSFGRWILASCLLWESNVLVYPWLLTAFHGVAATGLWAACYGVVAIANPLLLGMQNFLGPQMAHSYAGGGVVGLQQFTSRSTVVFSAIVFPLAVILLAFGGPLVAFVYGAKFANNGPVVVPLAIEMLIAPARVALSKALMAVERADLDFATNLSSPVVLLVLGLWLVRGFGPVGVAWGFLAGSVIVTIAKYIAYILTLRSLRRGFVT